MKWKCITWVNELLKCVDDWELIPQKDALQLQLAEEGDATFNKKKVCLKDISK